MRRFWLRTLLLALAGLLLLSCGDLTGPKLCEQNPSTYKITDSTTTDQRQTINVTVYRCNN